MTAPHIVLIVADNLGWGELGCYGGGALRGAPTPRIDALAREGLLLQNFNVESDCVPTRSALMTGRHPIRTGCLQSVPPGLPQASGRRPRQIPVRSRFRRLVWHSADDRREPVHVHAGLRPVGGRHSAHHAGAARRVVGKRQGL
jgi:hypothetical protein